jgi:DNA-binding response OmpR family regulator
MGMAIESERLLSMVWGEQYNAQEGVLVGTVRRLRQKLERAPEDPVHIITDENGGYLMPEITKEFGLPAIYGGKGTFHR